jgi:indolepyruvate ferredoxin oxidoreductase beta subunit
VLIGLLARTSSIPKEIWLKSIEEVVPQRFLEVNIKAFNSGYKEW